MASSFTDLIRLEKQANGEGDSTWGDKVNIVFEMIEDAIAGMAIIYTTGGTYTLSANNSSTDESRMSALKITGVLVSNSTIIIPSSTKRYTVWNATTGAFTVTVKTAGGAGVSVLSGRKTDVFCDGLDASALGSEMPPTTVMSFFQAAAPLGWTQITSHNDKAMRIVSGTGGGTGGTVAFTSAFKSQGVSGSNSATTLTEATTGVHRHNLLVGSGATGTVRPDYNPQDGNSGNWTAATEYAGGGASHNHTFTGTAINLAVQYIDMILASKD